MVPALSFLGPKPVRADSRPASPTMVVELAHDVSPSIGDAGQTTTSPAPALLPGTGAGALLGPMSSFDGLANVDQAVFGDQWDVPDTEGDVGPLNYVQWVNSSLAVYTKSGERLLGPLPGNRVWSTFPQAGTNEWRARLCETWNQGDPVVLYDQLADRWILSQFAHRIVGGEPVAPFVQCVAVSTSGDPIGSYFRYAFLMPNDGLNDYVKLAMWPDEYLMTDVEGGSDEDEGLSTSTVRMFAFDRHKMLEGLATTGVTVQLRDASPLLPVDFDGTASSTAPWSVGPPLFVRFQDDGDRADQSDSLELWRFRPDFSDPASSVITGPRQLLTDAFDSTVCSLISSCIRQPSEATAKGSAGGLDPISDRLMFRAEYRRVSGYDALALAHTVRVGDQAGIRWYELRNSGAGLAIARGGTYAGVGDDDDRWMESIAVDRLGNIGLGFSVSGANRFPSIGYTGIAADKTNPEKEGLLVVGGGAQTGLNRRWGDYSSLTVDPVDGCSFWYTQEYYAASSSRGWRTRIGSFKFPSCGAVPTITGSPEEGGPLTAAIDAEPEDASVSYQWRRCDARGGGCSNIEGATDPQYTLSSADVDATVRVTAAMTSASGVTSSLSYPTPLVVPAETTGSVDLAVRAEASAASVPPRTPVRYTIRTANGRGSATATRVVLTVLLPPRLALASRLNADRGRGCKTERAMRGSTRLTCRLDFIPVGRTATLSFDAKARRRGRLDVDASVGSYQSDLQRKSNRASVTVRFHAPPQLRLVGRHPVRIGVGGSREPTLSTRLRIDEPALVTTTVENGVGNRIILLPGSRVGARTLRASSRRIDSHVRATGGVRVILRLRRADTVPGKRYRLRLRATDRDGERASLNLAFRLPTRLN
jgi:hypothetical protein